MTGNEFFAPTIVFLVLIGVKLILVQKFYGPVLFFDELLYKQFAEALFNGISYINSQYPPLYSLAIAPAFLLGDNFYEAIKTLNVVYSSLVIFPTWLICRIFLPKRTSIICAIGCALIPYHIVYPGMVMSENIYMPILLLAVYTALADHKKHEVMWAILFGILIGMLHLTRHMSLAITPVLLSIWLIKPSNGQEYWLNKKKIIHLLIVCVSATLIFLPWILNLKGSYSFLQIISHDFIEKAQSIEKVIPTMRYIQWGLINMAYIIILISPVLYPVLLMLASLKRCVHKRIKMRYILLFALLSLSLVIISTRHHAQAGYNQEIFSHMHGRYLLYLIIPGIILGFIAIHELANDHKNGKTLRIILMGVLNILLLIFAFFLIIKKAILPLHPSFLMSHVSGDIIFFNFFPDYFLFFLLTFSVLLGGFLIIRGRTAAIILSIGTIFFFLSADILLYPKLIAERAVATHGRNIAKVASTINIGNNEEEQIYVGTNKIQTVLEDAVKFWSGKKSFRLIKSAQMDKRVFTEQGIWVKDGSLGSNFDDNLMLQYQVEGADFFIYKLPISKKNANLLAGINFANTPYMWCNGVYFENNQTPWINPKTTILLNNEKHYTNLYIKWFTPDITSYTKEKPVVTIYVNGESLNDVAIEKSGEQEMCLMLPKNSKDNDIVQVNIEMEAQYVPLNNDKRKIGFLLNTIGLVNTANCSDGRKR